MAVKIRLRQQGRNNRQTYRLVVADVRSPRDGKYIEMLGWYNPFQAEGNIEVNPERIAFWLEQGAELTDKAETIIAKKAPEALKVWSEKKVAKRKKVIAQRKK